MSVLLRGSLFLVISFIFIAIIVYQSLSKKSVRKRAYTYLLLSSIFFPFLDLGISAGGLNLKVFYVGTITYFIFNYRPLIKIAKQYYLIPIYVVTLLFTSLMSEFVTDSLLSILDKLIGAIVFLAAIIVYDSIDEKNRLKLFAKYMKVPIITTILFGLIQVFINQDFTFFFSVVKEGTRISSCYLDPQIAGCATAMLASYIWNKYLNNRNNFYLAIIAILVYIGLQTGSKVFILGFIISLITPVFFTRKKTKFIITILIVAIVFILTQDYWSQLYIFERINDAESSLETRQGHYWLCAFKIFKDNWFCGIGSGIFKQYIEKHNIDLVHHQVSSGEIIYADQPESGYLLWLDELGIFSIIYIVIILYFVFKKFGNRYINLSIIAPWFIAFISLYNLKSYMLAYILFTTLALMVIQTENRKHFKQ